MTNEGATVKGTPQDPGRGFSDFLDKVHARIVQRAEEEHILGVRRVGNVWRLDNAEATISQGASPSELLVNFRSGPDASRASRYKAGSAESTADAIVDRFKRLTRTLV